MQILYIKAETYNGSEFLNKNLISNMEKEWKESKQ